MFTGIVQDLGTVRSLGRTPAGHRLLVHASRLPRPLRDGDSIAVSGVCLTITRWNESEVEFDVVPETLGRSTLGKLQPGHRVNLESSLRLGDPVGGHLVQGHVDAIGTVRRLAREGEWVTLGVNAEPAAMECIIEKGSVAVDGVSLTVASTDSSGFSVALIPTTLATTTLGRIAPGDALNLETDIMVRTIVATLRRLGGSRSPGLTLEALRENGWA